MIEKKTRDTIAKYGMLRGGETVLAAISGGADSIAMLHLLLSLKDEMRLNIIVCHLNHNLRGAESERDFQFVKKAAESLGLPFEGKRLRKGELKKKGESAQEAAREARYRFFEESAKKYGALRIALGHTLDDQAETVLMRAIKGASLSGLAGIPPVRGPYIRPLIEIRRAEVEEFLRKKGLSFVTDSSNLAAKYLRNSVRLKLIPFIRENYNARFSEALGRLASSLAKDDDFIENSGSAALERSIIKKTKDSVTLDRVHMAGLHEALSARVFLKAARALTVKDLYSSHVESFLKVVKGSNPSSKARLPGGLCLSREYDIIRLSRAPALKLKAFERRLKLVGTTVIKGAGSFKVSVMEKMDRNPEKGEKTAYFDMDAAGEGLILRPMRPGDRFIPFGMKGRKKVKEAFIEKKVPKDRRPFIPLLVKGDDILWVPGVRRSDLFKVTAGARRVLKIEWNWVDAG